MNDRQLKEGDRVCWWKRTPSNPTIRKGRVISHTGGVVKVKSQDGVITIPRPRVRMESILRD